MFGFIKSLFSGPQPAGPAELLKEFSVSEQVIDSDQAQVDMDGWKLNISEKGAVRLFELPVENIDRCLLTYRAKMKSNGLKGKAYLEMWCKLSNMGEFFSKGIKDPVKGSMDWREYEIPFLLKPNQSPELIKFNVHGEGSGTVWIKDIQLYKTPLQ